MSNYPSDDHIPIEINIVPGAGALIIYTVLRGKRDATLLDNFNRYALDMSQLSEC